MNNEVVTSINAGGFVVAEYDTAHFSLSFSEYAPKAKAAKAKLKQGVEKVNKALATLKENGLVMLEGTYLSGPTVNPNWVYDQNRRVNVLDGQKATYSVSFQTQSLDLVNEAYDYLSDLELNEVNVPAPSFSVKAVSALKQLALEDAWRVAQALFANQCAVLGLNPNNYTVSTWNVNYSDQEYGGKFRNSTAVMMEAAGGSGYDDDSIEINAGKAKVKVTLAVSYVRSSS